MDSADEETKQTYREMETRLQEENKKTNAETDEVKAKMEKLKNNDKGQEDWEKMLDEAIDKGKKDPIERWDKLNKFGKDKIRKLKEKYRKPAVMVYTGGLRAVSGFISKAVDWLQTAWNTLEQ
ncbi:hypothetical protein N7527_003773 [Penicillium freii]|uniref:Uncharacterized protein n=1 Tax=Penicillium freii TaxID=48697 RepID=A0A101MQL4_PENFR|nr:hypothetical protein N7527_003773 [Penicillium freii]KUM64922.1 hypothetical protein ACN42_g2166 [Penicillium freii]